MALRPEAGGGPAFPTTPNGETVPGVRGGMTLRDWFAGQALAGLIAGPDVYPCRHARDNPDNAAQWAYGFADAMLAARGEAP